MGEAYMDEKDILKRLITNDALFENIHVIQQEFNIIPESDEHIGAYIEYQDIQDRTEDFLDELIDSIVDWVYSSNRYSDLLKQYQGRGKSKASANSAILRKAKTKFRKTDEPNQLLAQGQFGELLLFHFIQRFMHAVPLLRKMSITTSPHLERNGADAIHYKVENGKNIIILGEAKTYTSKYSFNNAFETGLKSILDTYNNHRKEISLYIHEDFLDNEMNQIAELYLTNRLDSCEINLVCIIVYHETRSITITNQKDIQNQIEKIIEERYDSFDNSKIDINNNPILRRITYIVFPIWKLDDLVRGFQDRL